MVALTLAGTEATLKRGCELCTCTIQRTLNDISLQLEEVVGAM